MGLEVSFLKSEIIVKFKNKGIKIEKTKSRMEVFKNLFQIDPTLLALPSHSTSNHMPYLKERKQ
ncbi:hypothetical protein JOC77_003582 [Peribacillus deserti]|uniref:Uncharacterized protein n=1 Tax=Peribacillus deserti TaxID=673318 RepID=A0ABS2QLU9_9BACI|nr:hypothetical protein [Peribacillus deserti]